jgi:alpha-beta hydrolase superfamily lysophospholipase
MVRADALADVLGGSGAGSLFLTATDGVRLHVLHWPSGRSPPWAVVIFLHGIASHAGWFGETAANLSKQGAAIYAPDRRGSGRSSGPRGHLTRYERALDDVEQVVRLVSTEHPATPVFLAASSWAAKLAVVYAARRPAPLSGLLLLGPGLLPTVNLAPGRRVRVVIGHLATPTARLPIPLTPELYTANPPTSTSSGPTRCVCWRPRPSSSGRRRAWTAGVGGTPPSWTFRSSSSSSSSSRGRATR